MLTWNYGGVGEAKDGVAYVMVPDDARPNQLRAADQDQVVLVQSLATLTPITTDHATVGWVDELPRTSAYGAVQFAISAEIQPPTLIRVSVDGVHWTILQAIEVAQAVAALAAAGGAAGNVRFISRTGLSRLVVLDGATQPTVQDGLDPSALNLWVVRP